MSEKRFFHVGRDGKPRRLAGLDELLAALQGGGYAWLDFFDPSAEDLMPLVEPLGLHPLSVEDCLDENQVPKIEEFPTKRSSCSTATATRTGAGGGGDGLLPRREVPGHRHRAPGRARSFT